MIVFVLIEKISFPHIFFFLLATSFVVGRNSPAMHGWRKTVFMKQHFFFSWNTSDFFCLLKVIIRVVLCIISSQNLKTYMKIASHVWLEIAPLGKFICLLKQWRIQKLPTWFSQWIVVMTKIIFYQKKKKYYSESKIWRHCSLATMAGYMKLNGFCLSLFFVLHVVQTDV